jgi:hypothetical protein
MSDDHRSDSEVILYQTEDGKSRLQVRFSGETAWLLLKQLSESFQRDKSVISRHIMNIFQERELEQDRVVADFAITAVDGKMYSVRFPMRQQLLQNLQQFKARDFKKAVKKLPKSKKGHWCLHAPNTKPSRPAS